MFRKNRNSLLAGSVTEVKTSAVQFEATRGVAHCTGGSGWIAIVRQTWTPVC